MAAQWWFKFETGKWRNDSALRRCSLETKGFWIECIAAMREAEVFELSGTIEEVARLVGCFPEEAMRCLLELQRTKTADVTLGNGCVTVKSRYIAKQVKVKTQTNLRVQLHRSNANVTQDVTLQSKSKSKKEEKEDAANAAVAAAKIDPVQEVFDEWRLAFDHPRSVLDTGRRTKIRSRLKEGLTVGQLKQVIANVRADPWYMGDNDRKMVYDAIKTIFRDAEQVERLLALKPTTTNGNGNGQPYEPVYCDECRELGGFVRVVDGEGNKRRKRCDHGKK
jgi:hypothetical protein